jgi:outer membrane protein assembly factor BamA
MRYAVAAGVKWLCLVTLACGCATTSPRATCNDGWSSLSRTAPAPQPALQKREPVVIENVRVSGVDSRVAELLRTQLATKPGLALDDAPLAEDLRRLWALGVVDDVAVEVDGAKVDFVATPRRTITGVVHRGGDALAQRRFRQLEAASFEPSRIHRMTEALRESYVRQGRLDATVEARQRVHATGVEVCVATNPGPKVTIAKLEFPGSKAVPGAKLVDALHGKDAKVNRVNGTLDEAALEADNLYLLNEYWEVGHADAQILKPVVKRHGNHLHVAIPIEEGPLYRFGAVDAPMPVVVRPGELFKRSKVVEAIETLRKTLNARDVTPITNVRKEDQRIDVHFDIEWRWPWDALAFWLSHAR